MRTRSDRDRARNIEWVCARPSRGESIDGDRLSWLSQRHRRRLLDVTVTDGTQELRYDVSGLTTLREFVRRGELSSLQYENVLVTLGEAIATCVGEGQPSGLLSYDDRTVFVDPEGCLWLVFFPIAGDRLGRRDDAGRLIDILTSRRRVSLISEDDSLRASRLRQIMRDAGGFSEEAYAAFLLDEYGVRIGGGSGATRRRPPAQTILRSDVVEELGNGGQAEAAGGECVSGDESNDLYAFDRYRENPKEREPEVPAESEGEELPPVESEAFPDLLDPSNFDGLTVLVDGTFGGVSDGIPDEIADDLIQEASLADGGPSGEATCRYLLVCEDDDTVYAMEAQGNLEVGRGADNDLRLTDYPRVSRRHARLTRIDDDEFEIEDLGSANGTFVRGEELAIGEASRIRVGEPFLLADATFRILRGGSTGRHPR